MTEDRTKRAGEAGAGHRHRFRGTFNWYGEVHVLYTEASCKDSAFNNFIFQLTEKLGRSRRTLLFHFLDEKKDNYRIERR
jgi:hypothetical protein